MSATSDRNAFICSGEKRRNCRRCSASSGGVASSSFARPASVRRAGRWGRYPGGAPVASNWASSSAARATYSWGGHVHELGAQLVHVRRDALVRQPQRREPIRREFGPALLGHRALLGVVASRQDEEGAQLREAPLDEGGEAPPVNRRVNQPVGTWGHAGLRREGGSRARTAAGARGGGC